MLITLNAKERIWAVPAILGQAEVLRELHARLQERLVPGDCLVYLGNYMGFGPLIAETVDELLRFRAACTGVEIAHLRGAQEEMWVKLLEIQWAMRPSETFKWMMEHGVGATLRAYGGDPSEASAKFRSGVVVTARWTTALRENFQSYSGHYEFLHGLASAVPTSNGKLLFVNAGIDPNKPLEKQNDAFWWNSRGFETLDAPFESFAFVIRGYDAARKGGRSGPLAICIDTATGPTGPLSATCFDPDGAIIERI